MKLFLRQLKNELYRLFARRRTYIGFAMFFLLQLIVLLLLQLPASQRGFAHQLGMFNLMFEEYFGGLTLAVIVVVTTVGFLGALFLALVAGDIVAKEAEDGTLRMVLSRPITRLRLLTVKWLACVIFGVLLILFIAGTSLLFGALSRGGLGKLFIAPPPHIPFEMQVYDTGPALIRFALAMGVLSLTIQVVSTLAFMFSCFRIKPAAAAILACALLFIDTLVRIMPFSDSYRHWFVTFHASKWFWVFEQNFRWEAFVKSMIVLAVLNLLLWLIGAWRFCTRDVKT